MHRTETHGILSGEEDVKGQQLVGSSLMHASQKIEKYNERRKGKSTPWSN